MILARLCSIIVQNAEISPGAGLPMGEPSLKAVHAALICVHRFPLLFILHLFVHKQYNFFLEIDNVYRILQFMKRINETGRSTRCQAGLRGCMDLLWVRLCLRAGRGGIEPGQAFDIILNRSILLCNRLSVLIAISPTHKEMFMKSRYILLFAAVFFSAQATMEERIRNAKTDYQFPSAETLQERLRYAHLEHLEGPNKCFSEIFAGFKLNAPLIYLGIKSLYKQNNPEIRTIEQPVRTWVYDREVCQATRAALGAMLAHCAILDINELMGRDVCRFAKPSDPNDIMSDMKQEREL